MAAQNVIVSMSMPTLEEFDVKQKECVKAIGFKNLDINKPYAIKSCELKDTRFGKSYLLSMSYTLESDDNIKCFAPSTFARMIKQFSIDIKKPFFMLYKGMITTQSEQGEIHMYDYILMQHK